MKNFIADNTEALLAGYKNLERIVPSVFSDKNTTKNNIVFSIEKYQLTILATEFGIGTLELPQVIKHFKLALLCTAIHTKCDIYKKSYVTMCVELKLKS